MKRRRWIEEAARAICREVYEATNAQPDEWAQIADYGESMHAPVVYAVGRRWLIVDRSRVVRVKLTDEGRREVRKTLS